ncbi:MAG: hypothetical protein MUO31_13125 [Thermodesulfovibrionales bacterium]|nr:hypothetical protein [Thermodesulfovibrionales bacterium]
MNKIILTLILALFPPLRPPALTPAGVPFAYDPNLVTSDILTFYEVRPSNAVVTLHRQVTELDGEYGTLTCNDPMVVIPQAVTTIDPDDPNGISRIHEYACSIRPGTVERIIYLEFTFTDDPNGVNYAAMRDVRTVLVDVRKWNRKPIFTR